MCRQPMNNLEQGEEEIKKTLNIENGLVTIGSSETALRFNAFGAVRQFS